MLSRDSALNRFTAEHRSYNPFLFLMFFSSRLLHLALYLQLPPFRNSNQPLDHMAGTFPRPPRYGARLLFHRAKGSALSSRVDASIHTPLGAMVYMQVFFFARKIPLGGIRAHAIDLSSHEVKTTINSPPGRPVISAQQGAYFRSGEGKLNYSRNRVIRKYIIELRGNTPRVVVKRGDSCALTCATVPLAPITCPKTRTDVRALHGLWASF